MYFHKETSLKRELYETAPLNLPALPHVGSRETDRNAHGVVFLFPGLGINFAIPMRPAASLLVLGRFASSSVLLLQAEAWAYQVGAVMPTRVHPPTGLRMLQLCRRDFSGCLCPQEHALLAVRTDLPRVNNLHLRQRKLQTYPPASWVRRLGDEARQALHHLPDIPSGKASTQ